MLASSRMGLYSVQYHTHIDCNCFSFFLPFFFFQYLFFQDINAVVSRDNNRIDCGARPGSGYIEEDNKKSKQ